MDQETESDSEDDINNTVVWILIFCQSEIHFENTIILTLHIQVTFAYPQRWKLYGSSSEEM